MFKLFLTIAVVLSGVASASADAYIDVFFVPVDTSAAAGYTDVAVNVADWVAAGYLCFDLKVRVHGANDSWTAASCSVVLTNATFWNHPSGGDTQPNTNNFGYFGLSRFDSFWCSPEEWPNPDLNTSANATSFAPGSPSVQTATQRTAEWYSDPLDPTAHGGTYTIARYTFLPAAGWNLTVSGNNYVASTGGTPHPFGTPAEPSGLLLLALGGPALLRRR